MEQFFARIRGTERDNRRINHEEVQHRESQDLKLAEKWLFRRYKQVMKKHETLPTVCTMRDDETQTSELWSRDTCVSKTQFQRSIQIVICTTSDKPEKGTNKSMRKILQKTKAEESCDICLGLRRSRDEISTNDFISPSLCPHRSPDLSGAPNDTYDRLFDVKDCGEVSGVKHPTTIIREYNGCKICKAIRDRSLVNTCLQTDLPRYQIEVAIDSVRADPPTTKSSNNVSDIADVKPARLLAESSVQKSLKKMPNKAFLKVKKTSNTMRGMTVIAVKESFTRRKKLTKFTRKKKTSSGKKEAHDGRRLMQENDNKQHKPVIERVENVERIKESDEVFGHEEFAISILSDAYATSFVSRKKISGNESTESRINNKLIGETIAEPLSKNLATCSSCGGIIPRKFNRSLKKEFETESKILPNAVRSKRKNLRLAMKKRTIKTPEANSLQSNNDECENNSQERKKSLKMKAKSSKRSCEISVRKIRKEAKSSTTSEIASTNKESMMTAERPSITIRDNDDRPSRSFPDEKVSFRRAVKPVPRDKQMSSVMTIWHSLRGRYCTRGTTVSTSAKLRTPFLCTGSNGHDAKDPFLSLFFPAIVSSGIPISVAKAKSAAKIY